MSDHPKPNTPAPAPSAHRSVSLAVRGIVFLFLCLVPFRIVGLGFVPRDDVLRHAAKAASGRDWSEVLVLRPDVTMDSHPGWHGLLEVVQRVSGADPHALVLFSIVVLYLALLLPAVFLLRRPEAWALALAAYGVLEQSVPTRFAIGRPFLLSMSALIVLCLLVAREPPEGHRWRTLGAVSVLLGIVVWMHPSWHLFLVPVFACLLARRWRLAFGLAGALGLGDPASWQARRTSAIPSRPFPLLCYRPSETGRDRSRVSSKEGSRIPSATSYVCHD